jgi:hypothetical protein
MEAFLAFFDGIAGTITTVALVSFVVVNAGFLALVTLRRDRSVVNKFTKPLVVADVALLLAAGGAPVANWAVGTSVRAVALVIPGVAPRSTASQDAMETVTVDPITGEVGPK